MRIIDQVLLDKNKTARSAMYKAFDYLSEASKSKIIDANILRNPDTVIKGIEKGNDNLIRKNNIVVNKITPSKYETNQGALANMAGIAELQNSGKPIIGDNFIMNPNRSQINIADYNNPRLRKAHFKSTKNGFNPVTGGATFGEDIQQAGPLRLRHEIYEHLDPQNKKYLQTGESSMKAQGLDTIVDREGNLRTIETTMNHNSLGVLGKERKSVEGFSYVPAVKNQNQYRDVSGENKLLGLTLGKNINESSMTKKDLKTLNNKEIPDTSSGISHYNKKSDRLYYDMASIRNNIF